MTWEGQDLAKRIRRKRLPADDCIASHRNLVDFLGRANKYNKGEESSVVRFRIEKRLEKRGKGQDERRKALVVPSAPSP